MPVISIIVPVYKVEPYLRRCLDSVLAQAFTDYECILVDDGSPDNCPAICDEYAARDGRFKVIHKKQNEGLPRARRSGLDIAVAQLVTHLDSDDWLEPYALECLYKKQQEGNADIVIGSLNKIHRKNIVVKKQFRNYTITEKKNMVIDFFDFPQVHVNLWRKLYRISLFNNIELYPNLYYGEDAVCSIQIICLQNCKKIEVVSDIVYNHDVSTGGISTGGIFCGEEKALNLLGSWAVVKMHLEKSAMFDFPIQQRYYRYLFNYVYPRLYHNVSKRNVFKAVVENQLSFFFFPSNFSMLKKNLANIIFLISASLYKNLYRLKSR
jgi:glycosyltransferase involved in cell wall biosynthesis